MSADYGVQPLHRATQHRSKDLGVIGLRWVPCRAQPAGTELVVVEGGQNDALHDALATGKTTFTRAELHALRITPELHEDSFIRVGAGEGRHANYMQPQTPIESLLATYKSQTGMKDEKGMLPLHYAARNAASEMVIRRLLEAYPKAAHVKGFGMRLPLHWAAEGGMGAAALKLLVEANPAALTVQDAWGYVPRELGGSHMQTLLQ